jgi:hypothetical protein
VNSSRPELTERLLLIRVRHACLLGLLLLGVPAPGYSQDAALSKASL